MEEREDSIYWVYDKINEWWTIYIFVSYTEIGKSFISRSPNLDKAIEPFLYYINNKSRGQGVELLWETK